MRVCVCTLYSVLIIKRQLMSPELKNVAFLEAKFCLLVSPWSHRAGCPEFKKRGSFELIYVRLRFGFTFCANSCAALPRFPGISLAVGMRGLTVLLFFKGKKLNETPALLI